MPRRLAAVFTLIALPTIVALLAGCTSGPTDAQRTQWSDWADTIITAAGDAGTGGPFGGSDDGSGATLDFGDGREYSSVELRCIGTDSATFTLSYTSADDSITSKQNIVCQNGAMRTPIAIPIAVHTVTSFTVAASSSDGEGAWTALLQP